MFAQRPQAAAGILPAAVALQLLLFRCHLLRGIRREVAGWSAIKLIWFLGRIGFDAIYAYTIRSYKTPSPQTGFFDIFVSEREQYGTLMLQGLDWDTSVTKVKIADHWRLEICVVIGAVVATLTWHALFPHMFWFIKLWTGFATGATIGMFPGTVWQLHEDKRRPITSGWFVVVGVFSWGLFAMIPIFIWAPDLYAQEQERSKIRSLAAGDISAISVDVNGQRSDLIDDAEIIALFATHTKRAELF